MSYNLRKRPSTATSARAAGTRASRIAPNVGKFSVKLGQSDQLPDHGTVTRVSDASSLNRDVLPSLFEEEPVLHKASTGQYPSETTESPVLQNPAASAIDNAAVTDQEPRNAPHENPIDTDEENNEYNRSMYHSAAEASTYRDENLELATINLTPDEEQLTARDEGNLSTDSSRNPKKSRVLWKEKGKGIDPRNWGNSGTPENELKARAQARAIKEIKRLRALKENSKKLSENKTRHQSVSEPISGLEQQIGKIAGARRDTSRYKRIVKGKHESSILPSNQIDPKSFLSKAFRHARFDVHQGKGGHRMSRLHRRHHNSDSYAHSESDSLNDDTHSKTEEMNSNSSLYSDTESTVPNNMTTTNSGSEEDHSSPSNDDSSDRSSDDPSILSSELNRSDRSRRHCHRRKHRHHARRRKHKKSLLKPIPPEKYNGTPDAQIFHRFMTQSADYVKDGRVPKERQVSIISNFLERKAYTFYTREVAMKPKKWSLERFFTELFNYCFPPNFRAIQRRHLERCHQGSMAVKEYVSKLNELFTTVGYTDRRSQVHKLWDGFRPELQKDLWKDKLNPETSSFRSIVRAAELNEIADSIVDNHDDAYGSSQGSENDDDKNRRLSSRESTYEVSNSQARTHENYKHERERHERHYQNYERNVTDVPRQKSNQNYQSRDLHDRNHRGRENEQSNQRSHHPRLSNEERERRHTENLCYYCGEAGHISRQCPNRHHITSSSRSLGLRAHDIEAGTIQRIEELHEFAETTEDSSTETTEDSSTETIDIGMVLLDETMGIIDEKFPVNDLGLFSMRYEDENLDEDLPHNSNNNQLGTVSVPSEYTHHNAINVDRMPPPHIIIPPMERTEGVAELMAISQNLLTLDAKIEEIVKIFIPPMERMEGAGGITVTKDIHGDTDTIGLQNDEKSNLTPRESGKHTKKALARVSTENTHSYTENKTEFTQDQAQELTLRTPARSTRRGNNTATGKDDETSIMIMNDIIHSHVNKSFAQPHLITSRPTKEDDTPHYPLELTRSIKELLGSIKITEIVIRKYGLEEHLELLGTRGVLELKEHEEGPIGEDGSQESRVISFEIDPLDESTVFKLSSFPSSSFPPPLFIILSTSLAFSFTFDTPLTIIPRHYDTSNCSVLPAYICSENQTLGTRKLPSGHADPPIIYPTPVQFLIADKFGKLVPLHDLSPTSHLFLRRNEYRSIRCDRQNELPTNPLGNRGRIQGEASRGLAINSAVIFSEEPSPEITLTSAAVEAFWYSILTCPLRQVSTPPLPAIQTPSLPPPSLVTPSTTHSTRIKLAESPMVNLPSAPKTIDPSLLLAPVSSVHLPFVFTTLLSLVSILVTAPGLPGITLDEDFKEFDNNPEVHDVIQSPRASSSIKKT